MCEPNELCVNGRGRGNHYDRKKLIANPDAQVAQCVSQEYYVELAQEVAERGPAGTQQLEGETASMVFSDGDGRTPLEVQGMDWEAGGTTVPVGGEKGGCKDCVDLFSGKLGEGDGVFEDGSYGGVDGWSGGFVDCDHVGLNLQGEILMFEVFNLFCRLYCPIYNFGENGLYLQRLLLGLHETRSRNIRPQGCPEDLL